MKENRIVGTAAQALGSEIFPPIFFKKISDAGSVPEMLPVLRTILSGRATQFADFCVHCETSDQVTFFTTNRTDTYTTMTATISYTVLLAAIYVARKVFTVKEQTA